ncbi:MAG: DUF4294 domain-containing protein [Bacteroidales bacterium]
MLTEISAQIDTVKRSVDTLPGNHYQLRSVDRNGEVLPEIDIKEVVIIGRESTAKKFPFHRYQRLVFNLKKVYPYAQMVRAKLGEANDQLMMLPDDKERKKYLRKFEKDLFGAYEDDIRGMTVSQGKLLIKLIDRETYNTSYDLIRQYRGTFSAAFWQGIARIFGSDLKAEYDPFGEDAIIEIILMEIETGSL